MKRRQLFQATGGAIVLSAAALPALADEAPAPAEDAARIVDNLLALFAGTAASNASPASAAKRTALINTARARIKAMDSAKTNEVMAGLPLGSNEANLTATFQGLADIALITRMPGAPADLLDNASLQRRVLDAMALVHQTWYGDQAKGYYGNWYHWEIGMPTQISKVFGFLLPALDQRRDLFTAYLASMDAYLRNGVNGDVSLDSRFHTGANLADITTNRIIQGAIAGDPARIAKALSDQLTVYATVDPDNLQHGVTDGYYEDGSFIQHSSVPYTGSYENSSSGGRIGYQLLSDVQVRLDNSPVTASRRSVRLPNPDQQVTRQVFSMFADLAAGETRDLAWAILPGVRAADLTGRRPDVRVLSNSTHLQAVEHPGLGILMMNAFSARAKREHLTFSGPTSIVLRRRRRSALAISDPTLRQHEISLHWQGPKRQVVRANDRVRVRRERGGLAITINTRGLQGRSVVIETLG